MYGLETPFAPMYGTWLSMVSMLRLLESTTRSGGYWKSLRSWTEFDWLHSIGNYFHSEGINGARPRRWLPNISDYARGPLDRFGKVQGESKHKQLNAKDIRDALSET